MTNEEMQNTIQFILEHQAQLTVKLEVIGEKVDKQSGNIDRLTGNVDRLAEAQLSCQSRSGKMEESLGMLVQVIRNIDGRVDTTEKRLHTTDERMDVTDNRLALLAKAQLNTDKHLALLTEANLTYESRTSRMEESFGLLVQLVNDMDERNQREGRNGKSQG